MKLEKYRSQIIVRITIALFMEFKGGELREIHRLKGAFTDI